MTEMKSRLVWLTVVILGAIGVSASSTYEIKTVNERQIMVGRDGALDLWFSPRRGSKEIGALLLIVNRGDDTIDVFPEAVRAEAITVSGKGKRRTRRLRTYHPDQYERILRKRNWQVGSLRPDPLQMSRSRDTRLTTDPIRPRTLAQTECASGNQAACLSVFRGWHSRERNAGYDSNRPRRASPMRPTGIPQGSDTTKGLPPEADQNLEAALSELLRPRKIPPHESCSGVVYVEYRKGDSYHISIPLAATSFEFEFNFPEPAGSTSD